LERNGDSRSDTSSTNAQGFQLADHGGAGTATPEEETLAPGKADEKSTSGPASAQATALSEDTSPPKLCFRCPRSHQETTKSRRRRGGERKREADGGGARAATAAHTQTVGWNYGEGGGLGLGRLSLLVGDDWRVPLAPLLLQ